MSTTIVNISIGTRMNPRTSKDLHNESVIFENSLKIVQDPHAFRRVYFERIFISTVNP